MIADVANYSEWKNNRLAIAIIFSAKRVSLKGVLSIAVHCWLGYLDLTLFIQHQLFKAQRCWLVFSYNPIFIGHFIAILL